MVSVIVPVYNVEGFLKKSLDSILNQTFTDYEVILVDDGSTDNSGKICDEYAKRDSRITVIHQPNGGLPVARNAGLAVAKGDFIQFIDSDDLIHPTMLQVLYQSLQEGDYGFSMVRGIPVPVEFDSSLFESAPSSAGTRILTQQHCMCQLFGTGDEHMQVIVAWNKMYRRTLIEGLRFRKTPSEDVDFNNRVFLRMDKAVAVDVNLYFWVQRPASITHTSFNRNTLERMGSQLLCLNDIPTSQPTYRAWSLSALYKVMLHTVYNSRGTSLHGEAREVARSIYKKTRKEFIGSKLDWKSKFALLSFYHCPALYRLMRNILNKKEKMSRHS